ncbi:MAG: class I SAM-dependent methyltransferase [Mucilaginibacter sp.]
MDEQAVKKVIIALNWEKKYRENLQDINYFLEPLPTLDSDFENFLNEHPFTGADTLDIGTGTGEQAIFLAKKGMKVTATDVSAAAILKACGNAKDHDAEVNFIVDNILLTKLTGRFDLIIDRGCYTVIPAPFKDDYIGAIKSLLKPEGTLLIKTDKKKGQRKPFTANEAFETEITDGTAYKTTAGKVVPTYFFVVKKR